jgi:RNA polymerase sigma-70 factor (ECF subfamily)
VTALDIAWLKQLESGNTPEAEALRGERSAWNELIRLHNRRVVLGLIAAGLRPSQAQDLAQEAWLRLIRQADLGRLEALHLPGLVIRQALFLFKKQTITEVSVEQASVEPSMSASAEERYFNRERLQRARERLGALPERARTVFTMLYQDPQLSHAELASRVGLSVQRVRQILCEVRKELRRDLEGPSDE